MKLFQWKYTGVNRSQGVLNRALEVPLVTQLNSCKGVLLRVQEEEHGVTPTPAFDNKTFLSPGVAKEARHIARLLTV